MRKAITSRLIAKAADSRKGIVLSFCVFSMLTADTMKKQNKIEITKINN